jgi:hypothetical protein
VATETSSKNDFKTKLKGVTLLNLCAAQTECLFVCMHLTDTQSHDYSRVAKNRSTATILKGTRSLSGPKRRELRTFNISELSDKDGGKTQSCRNYCRTREAATSTTLVHTRGVPNVINRSLHLAPNLKIIFIKRGASIAQSA